MRARVHLQPLANALDLCTPAQASVFAGPVSSDAAGRGPTAWAWPAAAGHP
jgi:hypothetical protein